MIKEMVVKDKVTVVWVPGSRQLSDVMTKSGVNPFSLTQTLKTGKLQRFTD